MIPLPLSLLQRHDLLNEDRRKAVEIIVEEKMPPPTQRQMTPCNRCGRDGSRMACEQSLPAGFSSELMSAEPDSLLPLAS